MHCTLLTLPKFTARMRPQQRLPGRCAGAAIRTLVALTCLLPYVGHCLAHTNYILAFGDSLTWGYWGAWDKANGVRAHPYTDRLQELFKQQEDRTAKSNPQQHHLVTKVLAMEVCIFLGRTVH